MIPKNLDECYQELDCVKSKNLNEWLNEHEDDVTSLSHHTLGQWIRNSWGLWFVTKTPFWKESLQEYFHNIGIHHPDDMSTIILTSYHRKKNNKNINLEEQIDFYKKYRKKNGNK